MMVIALSKTLDLMLDHVGHLDGSVGLVKPCFFDISEHNMPANAVRLSTWYQVHISAIWDALTVPIFISNSTRAAWTTDISSFMDL